MSNAVSEMSVAPLHIPNNLFCVGIKQQLLWVESMALVRFVGSIHPIAVDELGAAFGQVAVPNLVGLFLEADAMKFAAACCVEEAEFDGLSVLGEQSKVDAFAVPGCTERIRAAGPDDRLRLDDHSVADRDFGAGLAPRFASKPGLENQSGTAAPCQVRKMFKWKMRSGSGMLLAYFSIASDRTLRIA